jgi:hypothetical protein
MVKWELQVTKSQQYSIKGLLYRRCTRALTFQNVCQEYTQTHLDAGMSSYLD